MMKTYWVDWTPKVLLSGFLVTLPIEEGPPNILGGLYLVFGLGSWLAGSIHPSYSAQKQLVWLRVVLITAALCALMSGIQSSYQVWLSAEFFREWISWSAIVLIPLVMLITLRSTQDVNLAIKLTVAGALIAILDGIVTWWMSDNTYPQLRSLGHVNQSALYLVAIFPAAIYLLSQNFYWVWRVVGLITLVLICALMIPMRSLAAVAVLIAICTGLAVFALIEFPAYRRRIFLLVSGVAITGLLISSIAPSVVVNNPLISEGISRVTGDDVSSKRIELFNTARVAVEQNPWFGAGLSTFKHSASESVVETIVESRGTSFDSVREQYFFSSHGHGLVNTSLVERGYIGLASLIALLFVLLWVGLGRWIRGSTFAERRAAILGLSIVGSLILGGLGNTTLHNEHGQVMMCLIVLFYMLAVLQDDPLRGMKTNSPARPPEASS